MSVSIRLEGGDELVKKLVTLEQMNRVRAVIRQEGLWLAAKMRKYPAKVTMKNPLISTNDRVRRGFFYHLKHGHITVPYKRGGGASERLGTRWTVETENQGWTAVIGNNASYAWLVQGERQTMQHAASGWLTIEKAASQYGPTVIANITAALEEEVNNVG